jgi:hypothetical protein
MTTMDFAGWAKRKATRARPGLVPVEVDIHTATGVHRAIRYHRAEDAKKMIAEGKAHEIKEMGKGGGNTSPPVSVTRSPPLPDYPHGKYQTSVLAKEHVEWKTQAGVPVQVTVHLNKEEKDYAGTGHFRLEKDGYSTQIHVSLGGKPEEGGRGLSLRTAPKNPHGLVASLGRIGLTKENYDKVQEAIAKVESHPEFKAYQNRVTKSAQDDEAHTKHVKDVTNMMTVGGRSI